MKSFKIRDKYYPATAIVSVKPPLNGDRWDIEFVEGMGSYLIDTKYCDEHIIADLCEYFGIPRNG